MLGYPHSPMLAPPTHVHVHLHFTKFVPRIRWAGWTKSKVPTYTARSILFYIWLSHLSYCFVSAEFPFTATSIETRRAIPLRHTLILSSPWMIHFLFPTEQIIKHIFVLSQKNQANINKNKQKQRKPRKKQRKQKTNKSKQEEEQQKRNKRVNQRQKKRLR